MRTREELAQYCDNLLLRARDYASMGNSLITFPGDEGGYGTRVDGLEGFARTFLLAGFRLVGEKGNDPLGLAPWYKSGIAAGTDPDNPDRWITLTEHAQAKVEAASIALILDMTREWIWDQLPLEVQENVIEYLSPVVGDDTYPRNNWIWFRIVVQTFLRSVGGPYSQSDIDEDLATHQSYVRAGGWYADGPERSYDNYVGWAMHLYPTLWLKMQGARELAGEYPQQWKSMLDRYLQDVVKMVGTDGSPLIQGRSLIYRFASAAPFWIGGIAGVSSVPLGQLRQAAMGIISHFQKNGVEDLLTMGWHDEWRQLAQSYSGPGSPYWATKGLLGIALPSDHPIWTAPTVALPSAQANQLFIINSPGWVVSSTSGDGIVRVINHGTDHAIEGDQNGDSPLYTRLGYSTVTSPRLGESDWVNPFDQAVVLIDANGRSTHRAGMSLSLLACDGEVAVGTSHGSARWLDPNDKQERHGSGFAGQTTVAGQIEVLSFVRGQWEIRLVRLSDLSPLAQSLRFGGWTVAGAEDPDYIIQPTQVKVTNRIITSTIAVANGTGVQEATAGIFKSEDDSPLGRHSVTPWITGEINQSGWQAVILELAGNAQAAASFSASVAVEDKLSQLQVSLLWPDQIETQHVVPINYSKENQ